LKSETARVACKVWNFYSWDFSCIKLLSYKM